MKYVVASIFIPLLILLGGLVEGAELCPNRCVCIWRNGKLVAECIGVGLSHVPRDISNVTQVFDLRENNLERLPNKAFQAYGLVNLQKVYLTRCNISVIEPRAFSQLRNLVELCLGYNNLKEVPSYAFKDTPLLRKLSLNDNPIEVIGSFAFKDLKRLVTLDLSHCLIETMEAYAFEGLRNLQHLKINDNALATLPESAMETLPVLHSFDLHNNPWRCDCGLYAVRTWMLEYKVPYTQTPSCQEPDRLAGKLWSQLDLADFACTPHIRSNKREATSEEGDNVTLVCSILSVPEAEVTWTWNGRILKNISLSSQTPSNLSQKYHPTPVKRSNLEEQLDSLRILNAGKDHEGQYECKVSNRAGSASSRIALRIVQALPHKPFGVTSGEIVGIVLGTVLILTILFVIFLVYYNRGQTYDITKSTQLIYEVNPPHVNHIHSSAESNKMSLVHVFQESNGITFASNAKPQKDLQENLHFMAKDSPTFNGPFKPNIVEFPGLQSLQSLSTIQEISPSLSGCNIQDIENDHNEEVTSNPDVVPSSRPDTSSSH